MWATPEALPVIRPLEEITETAPGLSLIQVPENVVSPKVDALPVHIADTPVIGLGNGFTTTDAVVAVIVVLNVPHALIAVNVYTPAEATVAVSDVAALAPETENPPGPSHS